MIPTTKLLRPAALMLLAFTLITGVAYPFIITVVAQAVLPDQANGSLIKRDGRVIGSVLIGQPFDDPKYFWGRLSATTPAYNAGASSGSNYGPLNPALKDAATARISAIRSADPQAKLPVPVDLVTSSASGLDPHISVAAAEYQAPRIARIRGIREDLVRELIQRCTKSRQLTFLGERVVNVLELNLELDGWRPPLPHSWKDPI